jgi:hypothetical protein
MAASKDNSERLRRLLDQLARQQLALVGRTGRPITVTFDLPELRRAGWEQIEVHDGVLRVTWRPELQRRLNG